MFLQNSDAGTVVIVPNHREIKTGTLHAILKTVGLTVEDLKKLV